MSLNYELPAFELLIALVNETNSMSSPLVVADVDFSAASANPNAGQADPDGGLQGDTLLTITAKVGRPFTGSRLLKYNRIPLDTLATERAFDIVVGSRTQVTDLLAELNAAWGIHLSVDDVVNTALPPVAPGGSEDVVIQVTPSSIVFKNNFTVSLVQEAVDEDISLPDVVTATQLTGFTFTPLNLELSIEGVFPNTNVAGLVWPANRPELPAGSWYVDPKIGKAFDGFGNIVPEDLGGITIYGRQRLDVTTVAPPSTEVKTLNGALVLNANVRAFLMLLDNSSPHLWLSNGPVLPEATFIGGDGDLDPANSAEFETWFGDNFPLRFDFFDEAEELLFSFLFNDAYMADGTISGKTREGTFTQPDPDAEWNGGNYTQVYKTTLVNLPPLPVDLSTAISNPGDGFVV